MALIHVWKSNDYLRAKSPRDRRAIVERMVFLLRDKMEPDSEESDGPIVVQTKQDTLIIWTDRLGRRGRVAQNIPDGLAKHFAPMLTVSATAKRTARSMADKLGS